MVSMTTIQQNFHISPKRPSNQTDKKYQCSTVTLTRVPNGTNSWYHFTTKMLRSLKDTFYIKCFIIGHFHFRFNFAVSWFMFHDSCHDLHIIHPISLEIHSLLCPTHIHISTYTCKSHVKTLGFPAINSRLHIHQTMLYAYSRSN